MWSKEIEVVHVVVVVIIMEENSVSVYKAQAGRLGQVSSSPKETISTQHINRTLLLLWESQWINEQGFGNNEIFYLSRDK